MAANQNDNRPRQSNVSLGLRALVLLYVLYLVYGIVAAYVRGDSEALSLPLTIAAANGAVALLTVTPEGGKPMAGTAWAAGRRLKAGDSL